MTTQVKRLPGRWLGLAALTVGGLVLGLDITILITAIPTLSAKLNATTDQLQWMSAAYTLSLAGFMLPAGVLGDRLGRKKMLLIGIVTFGISSVIASQMTSANGLIWMRAVMGLSGAIVMPMITSILPSMFAEDERQRAIGISGAGAFIGLPVGPLLSGWLLTHYDWGSIFLINAPVAVIAAIGIWFFIPESKDPQPRRLDWFGAVLEMLGVTGVVYGIIEEPVHGWAHAQVAGPLIGGLLLIVAFAVWTMRARSPLVDLNLFKSRRFSMATLAFTVVGFAMNGVLFVITPFLQIVQGNDAQGTGVRMLPMIGAMVVGAVTTDRVAKRFGSKLTIASGFAGTALGMLVLSRVGADSGYGLVALALVIMGLSIAFAMIPSLDAILASVPPGETGAGTALTRAIQNVAASFGVAVMGSILNNAYQSHLLPHLTGLPANVQSAAQASVAVAAAIAHRLPAPVGANLLRAADEAYAQGMGDVMLVTAAMTLVCAVAMALLLPSRASRTDKAAESTDLEAKSA